jgi:hypothetical protein
MKLNDSITTYDIAEALQGEQGKFEVTSPTGERYFVTCQPGHSISSIEWAGGEANLQPFLVRKVFSVFPTIPPANPHTVSSTRRGRRQS